MMHAARVNVTSLAFCVNIIRLAGTKKLDEDSPKVVFPFEYRLLNDLLWDNDPTVRPRQNSSHSVEVNIRFSLQQIYDLDEKRQILTISGWLTAEWYDDYLKWNPSEYGGIGSMVINPKAIWTPKLAIGNSANRMFHDWRHFWITVRSTGKCRWQPGGNFAFTCALDMNYYPFDEQKCTMEIETWFYTKDKVWLNNSMNRFGLETYLTHGEWTVIGTEVTQENRIYDYYKSEQFPEVYFTIMLRRKYTFYFMYILLPCIMLSIVLLMVFLLPAESGEKVSLGVSILVAFCIFLIIVAEKVPDTSDSVPVMAIYLMYFMMATALSIMTSTLILKLHYGGLERRPPRWLRVLVFDIVAPVMCLRAVNYWRKTHRTCVHYPIGASTNDDDRTDPKINGVCRAAQASVPDSLLSAPLNETLVATLTKSLSLECLRGQPLLDQAADTSSQKFKDACPLPLHKFKDEDWKMISEVLDRLFFWLFFFFILLPLVSLIGFAKVIRHSF